MQECQSISDILEVMKVTELCKVYIELYKLYRVFVTLPVTVASCESKLTFVKNKLCSTMPQDRLQSLLIIVSEKDITGNLDFSLVIDHFSSMKERRMSS